MVVLGINRVPSLVASDRHPLVYSRLRDIEAPMLGACYLTEWTAGLERLYDLGKEIETYRTAEELTAKLSELRADPERRISMRARAQRRALAEHSVARSIELIADRLGMRSAA
jgi:spore maturation protein CgeB